MTSTGGIGGGNQVGSTIADQIKDAAESGSSKIAKEPKKKDHNPFLVQIQIAPHAACQCFAIS